MSVIYNPVLKRELITSLRKKTSFSILLGFIGALSLLIITLWPTDITGSEATAISREMFQYFMLGQLALIAMMTPAFSAGSMTMEKEKACIDVLITSPISPFSILIGKYLSSVLFLFMMLLCSLPIVSICFLVGGVDTSEVVGGYLILIFSALTFGMIGLTASTFFHRTHSSLSITYLIEIPFVVILFVGINTTSGSILELDTAIPYALFSTVVCWILFICCWRRMYFPFSPVHKSVEEENIEEQIGLVLDRNQFPDNLISPMRRVDFMEDGENPVRVKEVTTEVFGQGTLMIRLIIQISVLLTVVFMIMIYQEKEHFFVFYLIAFSSLVAPAFACNSFTQEKERQTLDLLIVTMLTPWQIISGKLVASLRISTVLTGFLAIFLGLGWMLNSVNPDVSFPPIQLFNYLLILFSSIFFCTTLALFCSLFLSSTIKSMIFTYGTILFVYLGPILFYFIVDTIRYLQAENFRWLFNFSPIGAVYLVKHANWANNAALFKNLEFIPPYYLNVFLLLGTSSLLIFLMNHYFYKFSANVKR